MVALKQMSTQQSWQPRMRLVDETEDVRDRRMFERKPMHINVKGRRLEFNSEARQMPFVSFSLRDVSMGGLSAISSTPVNSGERISVYFPPQEQSNGWDAYGRVIRCEPSGFGYRVAVEFDRLPAA